MLILALGSSFPVLISALLSSDAYVFSVLCFMFFLSPCVFVLCVTGVCPVFLLDTVLFIRCWFYFYVALLVFLLQLHLVIQCLSDLYATILILSFIFITYFLRFQIISPVLFLFHTSTLIPFHFLVSHITTERFHLDLSYLCSRLLALILNYLLLVLLFLFCAIFRLSLPALTLLHVLMLDSSQPLMLILCLPRPQHFPCHTPFYPFISFVYHEKLHHHHYHYFYCHHYFHH